MKNIIFKLLKLLPVVTAACLLPGIQPQQEQSSDNQNITIETENSISTNQISFYEAFSTLTKGPETYGPEIFPQLSYKVSYSIFDTLVPQEEDDSIVVVEERELVSKAPGPDIQVFSIMNPNPKIIDPEEFKESTVADIRKEVKEAVNAKPYAAPAMSKQSTQFVVPELNENIDMTLYSSMFIANVQSSGWNGIPLSRSKGAIMGPSGKETYYNLYMGRVVQIMYNNGFEGEYWIRGDGVKMFGPYVMVAAHLGIRPKGTLVETSLGTGIVCDTGAFAQTNMYQIDIATAW